jgi:DNA anti-recombination protein RmuC
MLNKWAELVAAKADKPAAVTVSTVGYDVTVEREKLQFEKFKFEQELKFRGELETSKIQQEKEKLAQEREMEEQKLELQKQLEEQKLELQKQQLELDKSKLEPKTYKLKQFGDAIRNSVNKMSETSPTKFCCFFSEFRACFH